MTLKNCTLRGVRIARVSTVSFFIETQLRSQIGALVDSGAEVTVVASEPELTQEIEGARYFSIDIPRKINLVRDLMALLRLWLFFRREGYHIVHSTTPKAGLLCALAGKLAGVPIRLHTFTGQPWVGLSGVKGFVTRKCDRLISKLNTHCFADSPSQLDFLLDNDVADINRTSVLGAGSLAGIDLSRFNPARFSEKDCSSLRASWGIPQDAKVLLFVGRLSRDKGIGELIAAFRKVLNQIDNVVLVLLGPCETDMDSMLEALTAVQREKLIIAGFSSEPERFLAISDVLVLPSYREGFGTVVIEAAAMGVPTVGTNIYGLSDAIVPDETGLLVPVKNVEELSEAIKHLLLQPELRQRLGNNARRRVEQEFSNHRVNGLLIKQYEKMLGSERFGACND